MIMFWIVAALLSAGAGALMLRMSMRKVVAAGENPAAALHRRQLNEIDDLAGRNLLDPAEHRAARAEAARRLLEAAEAHAPGSSQAALSKTGGRLAVLAVAVVAPLAAAGIYATLVGAPGAPDQPFLPRVAVWREHPDPMNLAQRVAVATVDAAAHPGDPERQKDLAATQLFSGDSASAEATARRALALAPNDPEIYTLLAAAFTREAGGVTPGAREALTRAQAIVADLPPTDATRQRIDIQVRAVGAMAAEAQAQAAPPNTASDAQAAAPMIRQMVATLAARLQANPDNPDGWVMLVRSYGRLGDTGARDAALAKARRRYASDKAVLAQLDQAAAVQP